MAPSSTYSAVWLRAKKEAVAQGRWKAPLVSAGRARERVQELHAAGMPYAQIAAAAGERPEYLRTDHCRS